jgi:hypothetical protein
LIRGFVKCSLSLFLALKPIVEVPKIIPLSALLEFIKVVTEVAVLHRFAVGFAVRIFSSLLRLSCRSV